MQLSIARELRLTTALQAASRGRGHIKLKQRLDISPAPSAKSPASASLGMAYRDKTIPFWNVPGKLSKNTTIFLRDHRLRFIWAKTNESSLALIG